MSHCPSPRSLSVQYCSRWIVSFHLSFGRSLFLFPGISVQDTFLGTCSSSLLITCRHQFNRLSLVVLEAYATLAVPRWCSFLILSLRVRFSCRFVVANASAPYSVTDPISFVGILLRTILPWISSNFSNLVPFAL